SWLQRRWSRAFSREDSKLLMVCGAAAGVAAIFKAPATGMVFALEVPYRQDLARRMLLPAMFSAAAGYVVFVAVNGTTPLFPIGSSPPFDLRDLGGAAVLGLLSGVGARGMARLLREAKGFAAERSILVRLPAVAAVLVGVFAATRGLTGQSLSLGSGYGAIDWALQPGHAFLTVLAVFLLRALATSVVVGGGGVGGLFVPLVVQGALTGAAFGALIHAPDATFFPLLGVAAFLGAGYRVPLAAVVFVAETTGRAGFVVPALIAAATSQLLMGEYSVTPYQEGARTSLLERRLALPISSAMRTDGVVVPPDATISEFYDVHVTTLRLRSVPVVDGSTFVGMAFLDDAIKVPHDQWATTRVGDLVGHDEAPVGDISWTLGQAVRTLEEADADVLAVVDHGRYVGVVTMGEILKLDSILGATGTQR
ncbi:MAG TPA: chloride channel protein, partial [Acidimicrobiales bacterium]